MLHERIRPQRKRTPKLLEKRKADQDWQAIDRAESCKVKKRSGGRCEVRCVLGSGAFYHVGARCTRRATEVHHHIGGWKLRGRGASALAENKTHCCSKCHKEITAHVLTHVSGTRYRSVT